MYNLFWTLRGMATVQITSKASTEDFTKRCAVSLSYHIIALNALYALSTEKTSTTTDDPSEVDPNCAHFECHYDFDYYVPLVLLVLLRCYCYGSAI